VDHQKGSALLKMLGKCLPLEILREFGFEIEVGQAWKLLEAPPKVGW
jgi:hypothetical protein